MPRKYPPRVHVACGTCGKSFTVPNHKPRYNRGKYCSHPCYAKSIKPVPLAEKFWSNVSKAGDCWPWAGTEGPRGYGLMSHQGRDIRAHRVSWELHFGPIPAGLHVLHRCDNPPCVNPAHLFLGTQADNMRDKTVKGRNPHGENHCCAKLTERNVLEMRALHAKGECSLRGLARRFRVGEMTAHNAVKGQTWKHVPLTTS